MNSDFININHIIDRQISKKFINPKCYTDQILKNVFETSFFLYKKTCLLNFNDNIQDFVFSNDGNYMVSGGGNEDSPEIVFWKLNDSFNLTGQPSVVQTADRYKVTSIALNKDSSRIFSTGSDNLLIIHDTATGFILETIAYNCCIDDMVINPYSNLVAMSCFKDGLYLYDLRIPSLEKVLNYDDNIRSIQFHPIKDNLILIASKGEDRLYTYDLRNKEKVFSYKSNNKLNISYARYNKLGDQILVLRNYSCPVLFNSNNSNPCCEFDEVNYFHGYQNAQLPRKNCCFAGPNDEFVVTPSDSFDVFWWRIPKKELLLNKNNNEIMKVNSAKYTLRNQSHKYKVAYNYQKSLLACLGEGMYVNFYSPFSFDSNKKLNEKDLFKINENLKKINSRHYLASNPNKLYDFYNFHSSKFFFIFLLLIFAEFFKWDYNYTEDLKIEFSTYNQFKKNFLLEFYENYHINEIKLSIKNYDQIENKTKEETDYLKFLLTSSNYYQISSKRLRTYFETYYSELKFLRTKDFLLKHQIIYIQAKSIKLKLVEKKLIKQNELKLKNIKEKILKEEFSNIKYQIIEQYNLNFKKIEKEFLKNNLTFTGIMNHKIFKLNSSNMAEKKLIEKNMFNLVNKEILKQNVSSKKINNEKNLGKNVTISKIVNEEKILQNDTMIKQNNTTVEQNDTTIKQNNTTIDQNNATIKQNGTTVKKIDTTLEQNELIEKIINNIFSQNVSNLKLVNKEILKQNHSAKNIVDEKIQKNLLIKIVEEEIIKEEDEKLKRISFMKTNLKLIFYELLSTYQKNRKLFEEYKDLILKLKKKKKRPDINFDDGILINQLNPNILENNFEENKYFNIKEIDYFANTEINKTFSDDDIKELKLNIEKNSLNFTIKNLSSQQYDCKVLKEDKNYLNCIFYLNVKIFD